jgi:hypothetical protein
MALARRMADMSSKLRTLVEINLGGTSGSWRANRRTEYPTVAQLKVNVAKHESVLSRQR